MGLDLWDGFRGYLVCGVSANWDWYALIGGLVIPYLTYILPILYWEAAKYAKYAVFGYRVWV